MNRLAKETSPYLLQHQSNPVDWYPWGKEALTRAKKENKPIFLSIGYSACHWCHVMEHESFENQAIAELMNKHFVCIKVDREERPDLDEIYMAAVQAMTGRGGWPMSVFMTPDLKPFYGGTYFPPEDRQGMPGFPKVLSRMAEVWAEQPEEIEKNAEQLTEHLRKHLQPGLPAGAVQMEALDLALRQSPERWDSEFPGFASPPHFAPKFPHASELSLLLRQHVRTKDEQSLQIVEQTLMAMAKGGIYDQLGGGFHRYSVDRQWLVPHFEKMLYDNSLLARCYAEAYALTGKSDYALVLQETLDYMLREMQGPEGGFYSTQDADSEGVEGKFFVWTKQELDTLLGEESKVACLYFGVTDDGNWHEMPGQTVLSQVTTVAAVAKELKLSEEQVQASLRASRQILLQVRGKRIAPGTDDKVLAAWNGMAIAAMAQGYQVLGDQRYLDSAKAAADFVLTQMRNPKGDLLRTWRDGHAHLSAYLEDYGFMADGLLSLFECDFNPRWLKEAQSMLQVMQDKFRDPEDGNFYFTASDHETLITRSKSVGESSQPSGIAMAVQAFLRGGLLLGDPKLVEIAHQALRANHVYLSQQPIACPSLMLGVDFYLADPTEVVLVGEPGDADIQQFLHKLRHKFPAHHVVSLLHAGNREELAKLSSIFTGKKQVDGKATAYVCRRGVCEAPITDPDKLP